MVRLDEDDERRILRTAIVITALAFGFVAGFQAEHAMSGDAVSLPVLVAAGGGFTTAMLALVAHDE